MCSIAGYLGGDLERGRRFVERANRLMVHRGPNDGGVFVGSRVVLGNRRLSILDLTPAGHQPMISPDGRWVLVFNGEIYNHLELRARHCKDWPFRGHCDTETLLALLAELGPAVLEQLVGMWAFALWDATEERLLLSRDRYGQKPLYWRSNADGSLRFASEIKPLLEEDEKSACNPTAIAEFLALGNYEHLEGETFFRDIRSFLPGHWAWVTVGATPRAYRYWRFPTLPVSERRPLDAAITKRFRSALEEAVNSQLLADVTVGATLSGGLDSSAIVGLVATDDLPGPIPVFTAQAAGSQDDESRYVLAVEEKWKGRLQLNWTPLAEMRLQNTLRNVVRIQEEPFGDPSIIAHGLLMEAARSANVPVILSGQGGDELLFGYSWMCAALQASALRHGNKDWALSEMRQQKLTAATKARIYSAAFVTGMEGFARHRSRLAKRHWLSRSLRRAAHCDMAMGSMSDIVSMQLEAVERVCVPHLTHYDDRNGMARSIETRMPFFDHRLAEVLAELHPSAFLSGGQTKHILREACGDLLPPLVRQRRDKVGFFTPLEVMMQRENEWARSLVLDERARQLNFYDIAEVQRCAIVCASTTADSDAALRLWRCLVVRLWAEEFNVQPLSTT
jgi:asparagine synthase (glutamine-hydrolysing)